MQLSVYGDATTGIGLGLYANSFSILGGSVVSPILSVLATFHVTYALVFPTTGGSSLQPNAYDTLSVNSVNMGVQGFTAAVRPTACVCACVRVFPACVRVCV